MIKVIPAPVVGNAQAGDVRSGKTFSSQSAGIAKTGGLVTQQGGQTIMPGTTDQVLAAGIYDSPNTVKGDPNLVEGNIANGVTVFGVTGTSTTAAGNATPSDVASGKTFTSANAAGTQTGTATIAAGTATPADVRTGQTFTSAASSGTQTGTMNPAYYANGTGTSDSGGRVTVSGLTFLPRVVEVWDTSGLTGVILYNHDSDPGNEDSYNSGTYKTAITYNGASTGNYVNSTGFSLVWGNSSYASKSYKWFAYA